MNEKPPFLLPSSLIFENSSLVDRIHQSYIDLEIISNNDETNEKGIQNDISTFLQETIKDLENDLPPNTLIEVSSIISMCFSSFLDQSLPLFKSFYEKSRFNSNFIVVTSSILFNLTNAGVTFNDIDNNFISDTLNEILPQIRNKSQIWTIFGHQIIPQFQDELLINLLISSDLTQELFYDYFRFILSRNVYSTNTKFNFLLQILSVSDFLKIKPMTKISNDELFEFLSTQNFELISTMSLESFLLVSMAVISVEIQGEIIFDSMTEDSILQFISIVAVIQKKMSNEMQIESTDILDLICKKIESLRSNISPIFKESLKIIIDNQINSEKYKLKFPLKSSLKIMMTILKKIFNDIEFLDDRCQIFKYIFFLTTVSDSPMTQLFLQKNDIFHFVMKNLNEVNSYSIFNFSKFNLNSIKPQIILEYLESLQNEDEIIQSLSFLMNRCENIPKMVSYNKFNAKLVALFHAKVKENKKKEAFLIGYFLKRYFYFEFDEILLPKNYKYLLGNGFPTNEGEFSIDEIIELLFLTSEDEYFYLLIKKMLNNKEILQSYLNHLSTIYAQTDIDTDIFLTRTLKQFTLYRGEFLNIVDRNFYFNGQILLKKIDLKLPSLPIPEFGLSIVSKLFDSIEKKPDNYQAFVCLKNIACTFPFLFGHNSEKTFDFAIKSFNHISLLFEEKKVKNQTELVKTALSAVSFLFSFFQAPFLLDKFMSFIFQNILTFTNEQVACFMIFLQSFYNDGLFHCVILAYFMKYDFMKTVGQLLERDILNDSFKNFYRLVISDFLRESFYELSKLRHYEIIQIIEFEKMEFPFHYMYDYIYMTSPCFVQMGILEKEDIFKNFQCFSNFIERIEKLKSYWIFDESCDYSFQAPNQEQIRDFVEELKEKQLTEIDENSIPFNFPKLTIKMTRYLVLNRGFIYCWYLYSLKHSLVQPLCDELNKAAEVLKKYEIEAKENPEDEDNKDVLTFDIDLYMAKCYSQKKLLFNLIKNLAESINDNQFSLISEAIHSICRKKLGRSVFFECLSQFCEGKLGENSIFVLNEMSRIVDFLSNFSKETDDFVEFFVSSKCCDNLLDIVFSPQMRNDPQLLMKTANLFINFDKEIPVRVTHLIGFMFINEYEGLIPRALNLCSKFEQNQLNHLNGILIKEFNEELKKGKITENLLCFLKNYKKVAEGKKSELFKLLNDQLDNYDDLNAFQNIGILLNALAPERKESTDLISIKQNSPEFWDFYDKYNSLFLSKIQEDPLLLLDFSFLLDFPELVSFKIRSSYFRKKMKMRIDNENFTFLTIDRENILETSFNEIENLNVNELLNTIQIEFINEPVEDFGGGRREWFELLIKELFNLKNNLFECSKKTKSYQPSHLSKADRKRLNYFQFAGKIIARILIEGQCIDAHLTQSFYKQILHLEPNFQDLEDFDSELFQGLDWMLHNDVSSLERVFSIDIDDSLSIPLKENGENIEVNNDNKKEYVNLYSNFVLKKQIQEQLNAFIKGFNSLINPNDIKFFNQNELDLLLCGTQIFDIDDFKKNTIFEFPYSDDCPVIKMFFNVISKWENDDLAKLLMFMTGSSRVPANGFREFCEMTNYPLKIDSGGDRSLLPQSHTCFNILHLPQYETEEEMNEKLHQVIQYCDTFGLI